MFPRDTLLVGRACWLYPVLISCLPAEPVIGWQFPRDSAPDFMNVARESR